MPDATAVNLSLLVLRVAVGVVFLAHGINHVFRGGKIPGTARWFESLGMKPGVAPRLAGQPDRARRRARCWSSACSRRWPAPASSA